MRCLIILVVTVNGALAQTGSEIFLFDLKLKKGSVTLSNPRNITNHKGYDNQPFFHPDLPVVYYSSFDENERADIKSFNYRTKEAVSITMTPEREYSPTLTPDKGYLSCIVQRDNGAQDLVKYPLEGGDPMIIVTKLVVGYHAWADNSHIALFVLGPEGQSNTLHYLRLPTQEDTVVATNVGRSLHKVPGERAISFIQKADEVAAINKLDTETMAITEISHTISGMDHIAWAPDGKVITSDGTRLFFLDSAHSNKGWQQVTLRDGAHQLKSVTRLAVNARGTMLAVVVGE